MEVLRKIADYIGNMKIKKKLISIYVAVILIPILIVGIILTRGMRQIAVDRAILEASNNTERMQKSLGNIFDIATDVSDRLYLDPELQRIALTQYTSTWEVVKDYLNYNEFKSFRRAYRQISDIKVYVHNSTLLNNWEIVPLEPQIAEAAWYKNAVEANGRIEWQYIYDDVTKQKRLCLTRLIKNSFSRYVGVLVISLDNGYLAEIIEEEPFETILALNQGEIILSRDMAAGRVVEKKSLDFERVRGQNRIDQINYKGKPSIVVRNSFDTGQSDSYFNILTIIPVKAITVKATEISRVGVLIVVPSLIISFILIWILTTIFSNRIIFLRREMNKVVNGNFNINHDFKGRDEIGELYEDLNSMIASIKQLIHEVYEERITKEQLKNRQKEIEFKMLASQINPHFLYNALETIRMKAHFSGQEEIAGIVKMLARLMRRNLEVKNSIVSLESEIELVKSYLEIQKIRFEDRVGYSINWNTDNKDFHILPLLVQPIVENAFIHGLEGIGTQGIIEININVVQENLVIEVSDNGNGIDEKRLEEIQKALESDDNEIGGSIGLSNVNSRIKLHYGKEYGLDVYSRPGFGTKVSIRLPLGGTHSVKGINN